MRRRTILLVLILSWPLLLLCNQTFLVTWSQTSRDSIMALGVSISLLYVGLNAAISPQAALSYRLPWEWWVTPTTVRLMGLIVVVGSLVLGWVALRYLFGFIKP